MTGPHLFGRDLDEPETAVVVRVRDGRRRVSEGPLADAAAFLSGLDVVECADLDAAITAIDPAITAIPYLLLGWIGAPGDVVAGDRALIDRIESWRRGVDAAGRYVMGSAFGGIEAAGTLRLRSGRALAGDSPFTELAHEFAEIDIVLCADRREAITVAGEHPLAGSWAIEVRPFTR